MNSSTLNPELNLAWNFVEKTDRNIFLTGKAGTGKTTFLHNIKQESLKRLVVVAPTGVAAINAKGVTIHSFFQMPFGPIIPDGSQFKNTGNYKMKFSKQKIDIIRSLDLLIIDEISMVRADLLDAINLVLKRYKDRTKVFGGVQVLMIGDLQQLSPVVKPNDWSILKPYYDTAYFFSSKVFQEANAISIELKHIYRQDNQKFIKILNEIRTNKLTQKSADALNKRYQPKFVPLKDDGYITLTTHNNRANNMNELELNKLTNKSFFYKAQIKGRFQENNFPTHEKLELKVGAQVMFIKNDSSHEKRYYNGKIGTITYLDKNEVIVNCTDDDSTIVTTPEVWENISYSINQDTKEITEELSGSFSQMPLRLAWAITIHKSQGLTFEKAIIDAEASFAHGQTYVALSRCKTLEGIILKSKISANSIINDNRVESFIDEVAENQPDKKTLNESQKTYQLNLIEELFSYHAFLYPIKRLIDIYYQNKSSLKGNIIKPLSAIKDGGIIELLKVSTSFKIQLKELSKDILEPENNTLIQERISKAIDYFIKQTEEKITNPLDELTYTTDNKTVKKDFKKQLKTLEDLLSYKIFCLNGLANGFKSKKYLQLRAKAVLQNTEPTKKRKEYKDTTEHQELFEQLRDLRMIISHGENIPPFQVFTQHTLYELCEFFPVTEKQLLAINGMGKIRVKKYGDEILDVIQEYVEKNNLESREVKKSEPKHVKGSSQRESFDLFKSGLNIIEIANKRGFANTTIEGHLSEFIATGEIAITELIPKKRYQTLRKLIENTKFEGLSDLKNKIDDTYTYSELRMLVKDFEFRKQSNK
jgi:hypothetical protein